MDCEGLARLLGNGFTLQEAMTLLETPANAEAFAAVRDALNEGLELSSFFPDLCVKQYRTYLSGFLRCLSFGESLALCMEVVNAEEAQRREYVRGLFYPCMMFLCTLLGVILFNEFCFPPLLSLMEGFHVSAGDYTLVRIGFRILTVSVISILLGILLVVGYFARESKRVKGYILLSKHHPSSLFVQYESADFIRFFLQCIRMKVPTSESIRILKEIEHKPVIRFLAETLEESLLKGEKFETAVEMPWLDPALTRFLRIAFYSSEMETMLEGYLTMASERSRRQCRRITRIVQCASYACIGVVLILVYEILMLPMKLLTEL